MEHLERLIPLTILAAIAALVVFLIRRGKLAPRFHVREETKQPVVGSPLPKGRGSDVAAVVESPIAKSIEMPAATNSPAPVAQPLAPTPIQTVLGLLKDKDAVAVGFLLSEILGPPVSRRR